MEFTCPRDYLQLIPYGLEEPFTAARFAKAVRIRRELAGSLSLRYTPELVFELDTSIEHGSHINEIISRLEQEEQNG